MTFRRIFLAGTIQGGNRGVDVEDQGYRAEIAQLVSEVFPDCECFDPSAPVQEAMTDPELAGLVLRIAQDPPAAIDTRELPGPIAGLRSVFHAMASEAGRSDLCIAYLPDRIPSMGTAIEMYAAHLAGVPVVAVTSMVENLAVISTATWVLSDLGELRRWLLDQGATAGIPSDASV